MPEGMFETGLYRGHCQQRMDAGKDGEGCTEP